MAVRKFVYYEPKSPQHNDWTPIEIKMTEQEILNEYWNYWKWKMEKSGFTPTKEGCIRDWKKMTWAREVYE